nr:MAG TPA: hypothetical protein [Caudoviricetes sp.]DAH20183.1 MAG TPA: hypothetical protein [Caudoviricetes sp.]DAP95300.1 MAG TPA: hypothetical protein [Caudoviricetes sp.]
MKIFNIFKDTDPFELVVCFLLGIIIAELF